MKLLSLSVLLLTASASSSAMMTLVESPLDAVKAYNTGERKREVKITSDSVHLNGTSTLYSDKTFVSVLERILALSKQRQAYLQNIWEETVDDNGAGWYNCMQESVRLEMLFIKDGFIRLLQDTYLIQQTLIARADFTRKLLIDVLDLLEELHNLRIFVCRGWPKEHRPELIPQILIGEAQEQSFQDYAHTLKVKINASDWYNRMRTFDIE